MIFWNRKNRGVFTVEAAVIFPIILFVTALVIETAVSQYDAVKTAIEDVSEITEFNPIEVLEIREWAEQITETVKGGEG